MPCWEIIQCNKKNTCFCAGDNKKPCWDFVKEDHLCSFHICVDCLVYLAKHEHSSLSVTKFRFIMKHRKKKALKGYGSNASHSLCPVAIHPEITLVEHCSSSIDGRSL
jgi:hypothetical protein